MSPFNDEGVQFAWDSTSIGAAQKCLKYYQYTLIEGWQSRGQSEHLIFGAAYATALEHYFKYVAEGADKEEALERVVLEALVETWRYDKDEEGNPLPGTGHPWQSTHNLKNRENLIRTIVWYFAHFADDPLTVLHLANGKPAVELSFALEVTDDLVFTGHLDRVVESGEHKYVMDQKTTGTTIGPYYFDQFKPHTQFGMYTFAGKAIFNIPVKGVLIDAVQVAVGFSKYERSVSLFTENELNEWYDTALFWIAQAQEATRRGKFPMNPASCGNYGGCAFRHVCARSPEIRPNFLAADFDKGEPWNPLRKR